MTSTAVESACRGRGNSESHEDRRGAFRTVVGFPGYLVFDTGHVVDVGRNVWPRLEWHRGYLRVRLRAAASKRCWRRVHVLVLEAFVGPKPSPRHVGAHYPDPDPANNRVSNLRWATPEENEADKRLHGTAPRGGARQATDENVVRAIRAEAARGISFTRIGWFFDLHRSSVARIVRGTRRATRPTVPR